MFSARLTSEAVQEIVIACSVILFWGDSQIAFEYIVPFYLYLDYLLKASEHIRRDSDLGNMPTSGLPLKFFRSVAFEDTGLHIRGISQLCKFRYGTRPQEYDFINRHMQKQKIIPARNVQFTPMTLGAFRYTKCHLTCDKIYALLPLLKTGFGWRTLPVEYDVSMVDLYLRVTLLAICSDEPAYLCDWLWTREVKKLLQLESNPAAIKKRVHEGFAPSAFMAQFSAEEIERFVTALSPSSSSLPGEADYVLVNDVDKVVSIFNEDPNAEKPTRISSWEAS